MFKIILVLFSFLTLTFSDIILKNDTAKVEKFSIQYFYDKTKKLDIDTIKNKEFKEEISSQFAFGYLEGHSWFKFTIQNNSKHNKVYLYMTEPFFEQVNLFEYKNDKWQVRKSGLTIKLKERDILDISPAFILDIKPNSQKTFYIKAQANFAQFGEFKIYTNQEDITQHRLFVTILYIFFFGSLFIIMVFNSFLYITLKDKIYLYYSAYIFFHTIFVFGFSGLNIYLGWGHLHYDIHLFSIPLLIIFLILFSMRFLDIKKYLPYTYKILLSIVFIYIILMLMAFVQFNPWYQIITAMASLTYIILLYMSIRTWIMGHTKAKYYLFAMVIYTSTIAIMSFMINGLLPNNNITRYAFLFGSFTEIVLFTLLLTNRFHEMQEEKIKIQNELINIKDTNEQFLENEVKIRTEEIQTLLKDKEILLKEVYHRVKNNFQIVISMLDIESTKDKKEQTKYSFLELINRIKSMSLVHQFLYDSKTLSKIQSQEYILKIIEEVNKVYDKQNINIINDIDSIDLTMDEAMALGIIINEILNNAIKHHYNINSCNIKLDFKEIDNLIYLTIKDNGAGFDLDNQAKGLGLNLVKQFSKKLNNCQTNFSFKYGTIFELVFMKESNYYLMLR